MERIQNRLNGSQSVPVHLKGGLVSRILLQFQVNSCRVMKRYQNEFHQGALNYNTVFSGDFCRHSIKSWRSFFKSKCMSILAIRKSIRQHGKQLQCLNISSLIKLTNWTIIFGSQLIKLRHVLVCKWLDVAPLRGDIL